MLSFAAYILEKKYVDEDAFVAAYNQAAKETPLISEIIEKSNLLTPENQAKVINKQGSSGLGFVDVCRGLNLWSDESEKALAVTYSEIPNTYDYLVANGSISSQQLTVALDEYIANYNATNPTGPIEKESIVFSDDQSNAPIASVKVIEPSNETLSEVGSSDQTVSYDCIDFDCALLKEFEEILSKSMHEEIENVMRKLNDGSNDSDNQKNISSILSEINAGASFLGAKLLSDMTSCLMNVMKKTPTDELIAPAISLIMQLSEAITIDHTEKVFWSKRSSDINHLMGKLKERELS